jgi:hypothetical protein
MKTHFTLQLIDALPMLSTGLQAVCQVGKPFSVNRLLKRAHCEADNAVKHSDKARDGDRR